jgi:hypothetical protein
LHILFECHRRIPPLHFLSRVQVLAHRLEMLLLALRELLTELFGLRVGKLGGYVVHDVGCRLHMREKVIEEHELFLRNHK